MNGKESERIAGGLLFLFKRFAVASSEMARSPIVTSSTFLRGARITSRKPNVTMTKDVSIVPYNTTVASGRCDETDGNRRHCQKLFVGISREFLAFTFFGRVDQENGASCTLHDRGATLFELYQIWNEEKRKLKIRGGCTCQNRKNIRKRL